MKIQMTKTVREYMTPTPHTIGADQTVETARAKMRELHVRHLPVLESGKLVGVLSDRDLFWMRSMSATDATATYVSEAMTANPYVVTPSAALREVALTMAAGKYGSAIIVEHGAVRGVFTTVDAMRALADVLA